MNSIRSLFHTDNHDNTNQHLLTTHEPQKHHDTTQKYVTFKDSMTHQSNCLPHIDNTMILAQPSTSEHPTITPLKGNLYSDSCKSAYADVSNNISKNTPISKSRQYNSGKMKANENTVVEASIRRVNEGIDELEDQSVNIYTEVKKISYNMSIINTRQVQIISRLENIESLLKR